jgi:hypothetical protein
MLALCSRIESCVSSFQPKSQQSWHRGKERRWQRNNRSRTLLVVTTSDAEDVTLELIAEGVTDNLLKRKPRSVFLFRNNCSFVWLVCVIFPE